LVTNIGKIGLFNLLVDCFRIVTEAGWQQVAAEKRFLTGSSDNGL